MDSRIREAQIAKLSRKIVFICLGSLGSNTQYIEAVHTALVRHRALLTAEKEPCEDVREWDALTKEEMWNEIQDIRRLVDSDGTKPICSDIEAYSSQVADNRAEELRTENDRLKKRVADLENELATPILVNTAMLADQLATERENVNKLSEIAVETVRFLKAKIFNTEGETYIIGKIEESLAATETKVCGLTRTESRLPNMESKGCWHDASSIETGNGKPITGPRTSSSTEPKP